ncbi:MAG TPA: hydroxymethylglutaryl-CoA reductase, degradative [Spirochaetia bacterium]|nr:hydroxymethylglutaryl-CoA reductase, degradative [Spirochaetia bacterium]
MDEPRIGRLPASFRKLDMGKRRDALRNTFAFSDDEWSSISCAPELLELVDVMVETAVGCVPLPLGIAQGFLIDGIEVSVPMAVEEPSVITAASYAASLVRADGGFATWASDPLMTAQVFLEAVTAHGEQALSQCEADVRQALAGPLESLSRRGGGYRALHVARLPSGVVTVDLVIDVRDAMGANRLNTAAESVRPLLERVSGGRVVMAILSNAASQRLAGARFTIPVERLEHGLPEGMSGQEAARRVAVASNIAQEDPSRAVTHNKGIMNGIASLALATMNDTRAVEAAAHLWAVRDGHYRGLSRYNTDGRTLTGEIELPVALATVGGSIDFHPAGRACKRILGNPDARHLSRIAAAVGLAQNFAAVLALVTHGIQKGHMKYHAARLAYLAGARGAEVRRLAQELSASDHMDAASAGTLLESLRDRKDP